MPAVDLIHLHIHLQTLSTEYQHLIFQELCPATQILYLALRHRRDEQGNKGYLEQD